MSKTFSINSDQMVSLRGIAKVEIVPGVHNDGQCPFAPLDYAGCQSFKMGHPLALANEASHFVPSTRISFWISLLISLILICSVLWHR